MVFSGGCQPRSVHYSTGVFHRGLYESAGNSGPDLQYRHRLCPYDTWNAAYAAVLQLCGIPAGKQGFALQKAAVPFFIVTMYVNAGFIPYYLLISNIGLKNNFLVYILPYAVQAYFIILIKTYIESIPSELVESAEMDGAGLVKVFFRIILPLAKPILACIVVFAAVNQWNTWSDDMFFMQGRKAANLHCLQYLLYTKLQSNVVSTTGAGAAAGAAVKVTSTTLRMAMSFITVVPILCVYPYMQRFFTKGIMLGAVKG